jgi:trimeric autotransporter adhesin
MLLPTITPDVSAQQFTGGLRGAVKDASAVIPGVAVTLINQETNASRTTVSNAAGEYLFPAVNPGIYTLRAVLQGFKTFDQKGIRIGTQQFITLDILMDLGQIEEELTVTGSAPLIDTSNASQGASLGRDALEDLPSPGRSAFTMAVTIPTVNPVGDPQFNRQQDRTNQSRVSLGGGGIRANNYLVDGVPIGNLPGLPALFPTIEAVEEVKVQVHTYDSEIGRAGGGVFNTTARAGTNAFHGSGFYQTRPIWGQSLNFFDDIAGKTKKQTGLDENNFQLYGAGVGGPIVRNRTFFWTATENYHTTTGHNIQDIWPSLNQRNGNFSTSTISGRPVQIFNPWCRAGIVNAKCPAAGTGSLATSGQFTNGIIPRGHPAASAVGFSLAQSWPSETVTGDPLGSNENNNANAITTSPIADTAVMWTVKVEHKFTDSWSLSGFYAYNKTHEPGFAAMPADHGYLDSAYGTGEHTPQILVFNNTHVLNNTTVLTLRYGYMTWLDESTKAAFPAGVASLGFNPTYVNSLDPEGRDTFPALQFDQVRNVGGIGGILRRTHHSPYDFNGALSKLWGSHSVKVGADVRRLGISTMTETAMSGSFKFDRLFTSSSSVPGSGAELASLLLGLPSTGFAPANRGELEWFTRYYGAYIQDDWRLNSNVTLNYGIRFDHEQGLQEIQNRQTVAFDRTAVNPLDALVPKTGTLLQGRTLTGGLVYAGVNGAPTQQGDLPAVEISPRLGLAWSLNDKTVVRSGAGMFHAAWQYSASQHGQVGFTQRTPLIQSSAESAVPTTTLDNPFPAGLLPPLGSSAGLLTGVGTTVDFIDQTKGVPLVYQYSIDVQRQLPNSIALTIGYTGSTGRNIGYGGSADAAININQIDPAVARAMFPTANGGWDAAALRQSILNPFFGIPQAGPFGSVATIQRGQLLRPFPEFGDVLMHETSTGGRRQYNGLTLMLDKRISQRPWGFWGGRYSYTWSRTMDNQFAENSVYQARVATPQNNYNLGAEYSVSNFDSPHRIILAPIVRIPGPGAEGGLLHTLFGDWTASAIIELVSGSPLDAVLSSGVSDQNLGLFGGRQRPNVIGDANISGTDSDRVATVTNPAARWFASTAFANPGVGVYGTAPRSIGDARYQFRKNFDLVLAKDIRLKGGRSAEFRMEILNLTKTAKFAGPGESSTIIDAQSFGSIVSQAGFMRIFQLAYRFRF